MGKYDFVQNREEFDMENLVNDLINLANQEYQKNGFSEKFLKIQNGFIKSKNAENIVKFAEKVEGANIESLEKALIELGNVWMVRKFAKNVDGANITKLGDFVIKTNDAYQIYSFASENSGEIDVKAFEDALININDTQYLKEFAKTIENANIERIQALVLKGDYSIAEAFAKEVKNANIELITDYFAKNYNSNIIGSYIRCVDRADKKYLTKVYFEKLKEELEARYKTEKFFIKKNLNENIENFILFVKGCDYQYLSRLILELDDLNLICKYAEMSENLNLKAFEEKIISSNDPSIIVQFTMSELVKEKTSLIKTILKEDIKSQVSDYDLFKIYDLGGEDKEPIFDELLKRGNPKTLYDLTYRSVGEKYKKIEQALIETKSAEYIYRLATNQNEETNIKALENALLEIGDAYYLVGFAEDVEGADLAKIREVVYKNGTQEQVEYLNKILKKSVFEDMTEEDLEGVLGQL